MISMTIKVRFHQKSDIVQAKNVVTIQPSSTLIYLITTYSSECLEGNKSSIECGI